MINTANPPAPVRALARLAAAMLLAAAVTSPASAASCSTEGSWRTGRDSQWAVFSAKAVDAADGWKLTERKYHNYRADNPSDLLDGSSNTEDETVKSSMSELWEKGLRFGDPEKDNTRHNIFELTFKADDGTSVACKAEIRGKDKPNSKYNASKYVRLTCDQDGVVTCERNWAAQQYWVIKLTFQDRP